MPPRPKPAHLKAVGSNTSGYDRNIDPIEHKPACPKPPAWLKGDKEAMAEWKRIVPGLAEMKVLSENHQAPLAILCHNYGMYIRAAKELRKHGPVFDGKKNPNLDVADKCFSRWTKMLLEFGLTPSSQTRIDKPPPDRGGKKKSYINRGRK